MEGTYAYIAAGFGSLLLGGFTYWLKDLHSRVFALEEGENAINERLARIETKVDMLLDFHKKEGPDDVRGIP